jgi:hypothetical protein
MVLNHSPHVNAAPQTLHDDRPLEADVLRAMGLPPPRLLTRDEQAATLQTLGNVVATMRADSRFSIAVSLLLAGLLRDQGGRR